MPPQRSLAFTIAPFKHSVGADPDFANRTWVTLEAAITIINQRKTSELSFEELYRCSYNMCLHKFGDVLYTGVTASLRSHLVTIASGIDATDPDVFLGQLQTQWAWFKISLNHIRDILMYMDRAYVPKKKAKSVHDLGVALFRDHVVRDEKLHSRIVDTVLSKIDCERNGEAIDPHLIRSVIRMLAELGEDSDGISSVYVNVFENAFLDRARVFYAREAKLYLTETTCSDYLRKARQRMCEEKSRVDSYLDDQTGERVRLVAEHQLISKYMTVLVEMENSGLIWMLRNDKCYDLQLMYSLFRNVPNGEAELRANIKNEVLQRGAALVEDEVNAKDPFALVTAILGLKEKYDRILKVAFYSPAAGDSSLYPLEECGSAAGVADNPSLPWTGGAGASDSSFRPAAATSWSVSDAVRAAKVAAASATAAAAAAARTPAPPVAVYGAGSSAVGVQGSTLSGLCGAPAASTPTVERVADRKFVTAVSEAFERFLNSFARAPEYVSLYVDRLLRQDLKSSSDDEVERKLDSVMTLFRFLHEKDVFERYYKQHLAKRLLQNRTTSNDAERSFLGKLKTECGYLYTSKMETMFTDMRTSMETTEIFRSEVVDATAELSGVDFNVSVLHTISWPVTDAVPCAVPFEVSKCRARYEDFYFSKHEGRRLTWQTQMASGELRACFGGGLRHVEISLSGYGIALLMLFNGTDEMTYASILGRTKIPGPEVTRHLQSLAMGKHRVLTKQPTTRNISDSDVFSFNNDFTCRSRRIKIQMVSARKENEVEKRETRIKIDEDRKPLIEAAIVRIMKDRKVLEHQQLIAEVTSQVSARFSPNPQDIKKRIESLVEREFLERKASMRSTYAYVA